MPDLVLLDVNMDGISGYDVCIELRKQERTATLPIIFVSARDKPDERLHGYEVGADDYIAKPIDGEKLLERVALHLTSHVEIVNAQNQAKDSMNVALEAMTYSGEIGQLLEVVKESQTVTTLEGIGKKVCAAVQEFGLDADESRYGRIKDHLAVLVCICDGPILALIAKQNMASQRSKVLGKVIVVTEEKLKDFNKKIIQHDDEVREIMGDMLTELESKLFSLGLDEDQESTLMSLAYQATERLESSRESTKQLEKELGVVLEGLYEILANTEQ